MLARPVTRRKFLKGTAAALGAAGLACAGLAAPFENPEPIEFSETTYGESMMNNNILVTYASVTGSTAGVAEAIGARLAEPGARVDVRPMKAVADLGPYDAVVAGSAIQGGQWLPEAMDFVRAHRSALARKPFAAFLVCMTLAMKNGAYRQHVAGWMDPVRAVARPVSEGLFAGALDIARIPSFGDRLKFRMSVMMGVWSAGDHRDWNAIRAWADSLRPLLLN